MAEPSSPSIAPPRPLPAALPVSCLFLAAWIALPTLNRVDVTWHFYVGGGINLVALLVVGAWGSSACSTTRRAAKTLFALSLFLSFFLLGAALREPPPTPAADDSYFDDYGPEPSGGYL